ncbi:MAG: peptidylprolyl isomerase [Turicibacter sp.]|nr:peptidylprolyl isomerase [Turicibacter sp.]
MDTRKKKLLTVCLLTWSMVAACSNGDREIKLRLESGDATFHSTNLEKFTSQAVFDKMVSHEGVFVLMEWMDSQILKDLFPVDSAEITERIDSIRSMLPEGEEWEAFIRRNGFDSEKQLIEFLELEQLRLTAATEQISITEDQIREEYNLWFPAPAPTVDVPENELEVQQDIRPDFEEVRDELEQQLLGAALTETLIHSTLHRLRTEAKMRIYTPFLNSRYVELMSGYGVELDEFEHVPETDDTIVAQINGTDINTAEFFHIMLQISGLPTALDMADLNILRNHFTLSRNAVENLVNQQKINLGANFHSTMEQQGLKSDQEIFDFFELQLLKDAAFDSHYLPTDERVTQLYDEFLAHRKSLISVRHILVEDEELAKKLIVQLLEAPDAESQFKELAQNYSIDSSSVNGGRLEPFSLGETVTSFEEAALELDVHEFTKQPVQSEFGFHIIYRDELEIPTFEDMAGQLRQEERSLLNTPERMESILIPLREKHQLQFFYSFMQERYDAIVSHIRKQFAD